MKTFDLATTSCLLPLNTTIIPHWISTDLSLNSKNQGWNFLLYIYNWVVWLIDWLANKYSERFRACLWLIDWLIDWLITFFSSCAGPEWLLASKCPRNWEGPWFWAIWSPNFCCAVPWTQPRNIELGWIVTLSVLWITVPVSTLHKKMI